jgi:hypothetical protein
VIGTRTRRLCLAGLAAAGLVTASWPAMVGLPAAAAPAATVTVAESQTVGTLQPGVLGLSYEADRLATRPGFDPTRGNIAPLLQTLGTGNIRIGAGAVDHFVFWNPSGGPLPSWALTSIGPADVSRLASLAQATGWKVELDVNLGHPDYAGMGSEAQAAVQALGGQLVGMGCGNEPNLFAGGGLRPRGYGYAQFKPEFERCAAALAGAGAPVVGPDTNGGRFEPPFSQQERSRVSLLTDQQYTLGGGPGSTATLTQLLSAASVSSELSRITPLLADARAARLPLRRDETNSANGGGVHGLSDVYGAALWAIDYTLLLAQQGVQGFNFHGTIGQCGHAEQDHRVRFYTPLCAASAADLAAGMLTPQPVFYGLLMVHLLGPGQFVRTSVSSTGNVTAYSVRGGDGRTRVMVVDKDATSGGTASVTLSAGTESVAHVLNLTAPSLTSTSGIAVQGAAVDRSGRFTPGPPVTVPGGGGRFTIPVHAGSAALVTLG